MQYNNTVAFRNFNPNSPQSTKHYLAQTIQSALPSHRKKHKFICLTPTDIAVYWLKKTLCTSFLFVVITSLKK